MRWIRLFTALSVVAAMASVPDSAATQTPSKRTFVVTADTWVDSGASTTSHHADKNLITRFKDEKGSRVLLDFELQSLQKVSIQSARLVMILSSGSGIEKPLIVAQGISSSWMEKVSWDHQPDLTRAYAAVELEPKPGRVEMDVTPLVRDAVERQFPFHGISVAGPTAGAPYTYSRSFASRDVEGKEPKLIVEYSGAATSLDEPEKKEGATSDALPVTIAVAIVIALAAGLGFLRWRGRSNQRIRS